MPKFLIIQTAFIGDGWGQRDHRNTDRGATLPYIVRRTTSGGMNAFISVFEGHVPASALVQKVQQIAVKNAASPVVALQIDTANSRDYVVLSQTSQALDIATLDGILKFDGTFAAISVQNKKEVFSLSDNTLALQPIQP